MAGEIWGYKREAGVFGIRNHVICMASVSCVNSVVEELARRHDTVIPITHQHGCDHIGRDRRQVLRTIRGFCNHPNVAGALVVGLGCENVTLAEIAEGISPEQRMLRTLKVQELGARAAVLESGSACLREMRDFAAGQQPGWFPLSGLKVGLNCGGSDPFSGITANPVIGRVSDRLIGRGATVMFGELPELIGAEAVLETRIPDPALRAAILARINEYLEISKLHGCSLLGTNPTPGNVRAGLSSIEEKSLGCVCKAGCAPIVEFVDYAQAPLRTGLVLMDTPGNDGESVTGLVAGGAHVVLFSTGLGTPLGSPVAPVIKVASNTRAFEQMRDYMDLDAGPALAGRSLDELAEQLFQCLMEVCGGRQTASEINKARDFAINRLAPTF